MPNSSEFECTAKTPYVVAIGKAPGTGGHKARKIGPDGITLTERGTGTNKRFINNIAMENEDYCDSLLVTEVFTPAGHWSSYPSHRHAQAFLNFLSATSNGIGLEGLLSLGCLFLGVKSILGIFPLLFICMVHYTTD